MGGRHRIRDALIVVSFMAAIGVMVFVVRSLSLSDERKRAESGLSPVAQSSTGAELALPQLDSPVIDTTRTFTGEEREELEGELEFLEAGGGGPIFVVIVPTTGEERIRAFAMRLAKACDRDRDPEKECTLIVAAKDKAQVALNVGVPFADQLYEGDVKDRIEEGLAQAFRSGKYFEGMRAALNGIEGAVTSYTPEPEPASTGASAEEAERQLTSLLPRYDPLEDWRLWVLTALAAVAGIVLRIVLSGHGFISGSLGVVGGAGVFGIAQLVFHDMIFGVPGAILLATIAMGFGWFWLWFLLNLLFELLLGAITGGGGGGGGFGGGGGGFGGGGASGSW